MRLTPIEFRLLAELMARPGIPIAHAELLRKVRGYTHPIGSDVVRVTAHRLRRKLEEDRSRPRLLCVLRGVGVVLTIDAEPGNP